MAGQPSSASAVPRQDRFCERIPRQALGPNCQNVKDSEFPSNSNTILISLSCPLLEGSVNFTLRGILVQKSLYRWPIEEAGSEEMDKENDDYRFSRDGSDERTSDDYDDNAESLQATLECLAIYSF